MRRATIEDLDRLRSLWAQAPVLSVTLDKSLTEFQVVEAADGTLLACIGLQLDAQQGRIHTPCYRTPESRGELERALWERVQSVARNHGLWRLWTRDSSPFWRAQGFENAHGKALEKLPARFGRQDSGWSVLQLREEVSPEMSFEHEFEIFKQSQQEWTQRTRRQARLLRVMAFLVAIVFFAVAGRLLWHLMQGLPGRPRPKPARAQPESTGNKAKSRKNNGCDGGWLCYGASPFRRAEIRRPAN
jgi:N-acetylglutamate synthase-like GNAT family acetyltransferase